MNVRDLSEEWTDEWDQFCRDATDTWFWHTTDWLDYSLSYSEHANAESLSFLVTYAKGIQGICPLVLTDDGDHRELSFGGGYGPAPAVADETTGVTPETVEEKLFEEVDRLAREHDVDRVAFDVSPLAPAHRASTRSHNPFRSFGYLDTTIHTRLIDISQPTDALWDGLRDTYRHEIETATDDLTTTVYDETTVTRDVFDAYQALHRKDAGEQTRPQQTFDLMYEWIQDGFAVLVGAEHDGDFVEFAYFLREKDNVYYSSAASDPDVTGLSSGHLVQWRAIEWMHEEGCEYYEVGHQYYGPQVSSESTAKERDISFYKRGFGGFDVPLFRGEKFYDRGYFEEAYRERNKMISTAIEAHDHP